MISRTLASQFSDMLSWFPVLSLTGPRQSGKSTLLRAALPDFEYFNLEDRATRTSALEDPVGFLRLRSDHLIIDEAQYAPELFSQIQVEADARATMGQYVISGSQNFLMLKNVKQSLAGRVGMLRLLPLSFNEAQEARPELTVDDFMFRGGYPHLYDSSMPANIFYRNYLDTYVRRDVTEYLDVRNGGEFTRFVGLCAQSAGNLLNLSSLARDTGITFNTAKQWLSILESSFIVFLLQPYHSNARARLTKTPKLYFYDTGLLNFLLGIYSIQDLRSNPKLGDIFENLIIAETMKRYKNANADDKLYFYRDTKQAEIDLVDISDRRAPELIEIKSGLTPRPDAFRHLANVGTEMDIPQDRRTVVYRGSEEFSTKNGRFLPASEYLRNGLGR